MRLDVKRKRWLWGGLAAVVGAGFVLQPPRGPERLRALALPPGAQVVGVRREELLIADGSGSIALRAEPVRGGKSRAVFPPLTVPVQVEAVTLDENSVVFRCSELAGQAPGGGRGATRHFTAALDGSPPREVLTDRRYRWSVAGQTGYGLRAAGPEGGGGTKRPSELAAIPLAGGEPRVVARLPAGTEPTPAGSGAAWRAYGPPGNAPWLHVLFPPEFRQVRIWNVGPVSDGIAVNNGRLYWLELELEMSGRAPAGGAWELQTVTVQATDRQVVAAGNRLAPSLVGAHRGRVYYLKPEAEGPAGSRGLYFINELPNLELVAVLPPGVERAFLDGAHFYAVVAEKSDRALYRVPLPEN